MSRAIASGAGDRVSMIRGTSITSSSLVYGGSVFSVPRCSTLGGGGGIGMGPFGGGPFGVGGTSCVEPLGVNTNLPVLTASGGGLKGGVSPGGGATGGLQPVDDDAPPLVTFMAQ